MTGKSLRGVWRWFTTSLGMRGGAEPSEIWEAESSLHRIVVGGMLARATPLQNLACLCGLFDIRVTVKGRGVDRLRPPHRPAPDSSPVSEEIVVSQVRGRLAQGERLTWEPFMVRQAYHERGQTHRERGADTSRTGGRHIASGRRAVREPPLLDSGSSPE